MCIFTTCPNSANCTLPTVPSFITTILPLSRSVPTLSTHGLRGGSARHSSRDLKRHTAHPDNGCAHHTQTTPHVQTAALAQYNNVGEHKIEPRQSKHNWVGGMGPPASINKCVPCKHCDMCAHIVRTRCMCERVALCGVVIDVHVNTHTINR